jgi:hypothetical protein
MIFILPGSDTWLVLPALVLLWSSVFVEDDSFCYRGIRLEIKDSFWEIISKILIIFAKLFTYFEGESVCSESGLDKEAHDQEHRPNHQK